MRVAISFVLVLSAHAVLCLNIDQSDAGSEFSPDASTGQGAGANGTPFGVYVVNSLRNMDTSNEKIISVLVNLLDEYRDAYLEARAAGRAEKRHYVSWGRKLTQGNMGSEAKSNILRYG